MPTRLILINQSTNRPQMNTATRTSIAKSAFVGIAIIVSVPYAHTLGRTVTAEGTLPILAAILSCRLREGIQ